VVGYRVEEFPVTPAEKIAKAELRDLALAGKIKAGIT
jgi:hypothetical protein